MRFRRRKGKVLLTRRRVSRTARCCRCAWHRCPCRKRSVPAACSLGDADPTAHVKHELNSLTATKCADNIQEHDASQQKQPVVTRLAAIEKVAHHIRKRLSCRDLFYYCPRHNNHHPTPRSTLMVGMRGSSHPRM
jgi:hypothetical protein